MRTQLELWQVVKYNFDENFKTGLCYLIRSLRFFDIISFNEMNSLKYELTKYGNTRDFFLGLEGDPNPRLEFIEKMIKKHSQ